MNDIQINKDYTNWLHEIKTKVRLAQVRTALSANTALIDFYFSLGKMINEKENIWGSGLLKRLSSDLKCEFPEMQGFSLTNLKYCRSFYNYCSIRPQAGDELKNKNSPQTGDELNYIKDDELYKQICQIPWGHIKLIIDKIKKRDAGYFYIGQTIENGWSRDVLALQIKSNLHLRQGKAVTNFKQTLPNPQSDLAEQSIKDPYVFDFLTMTKPYNERDIELQLMEHISKFLLELGKGFAFIGRQYHLEVGGSDYFIDLLFYHTRLKCYVVIELKNKKFIPEYAGKLNFYLSAVDSLVKAEDDKPTIGILLCRDKKKIETEFALRDISKPMGVSEFTLTEALPDDLKGSMPTIEEIELEFKKREIHD